MAGANSNIQIADLDFSSIKTNFTNFLKGQSTFADYNFAGSGLSTLLDILTYNTQYNAYYLNMVANEVFLDSALQRSSVVSLAKLLDYVPKSASSPTATVTLVASGGANNTTLTLPRYSKFVSKPVKNKSYTFVNTDTVTATFVNRTATFPNIILKQGIPSTLTFSYSAATNPKSTFNIPNINADTSTFLVEVYPNPSNNAFDVYTLASNYLELNSNSLVYFLEEAENGTYNISFGNGVLGAALVDGSRIVVSYLVSQGSDAAGANSFALSTNIGNYTMQIRPIIAAQGGQGKESISSIKYQAPKSYAAQSRAVTKEDYITLIQQNNIGLTFDAVNVWGGEENNPPVYGKVFISLKPNGGYVLTDIQKQQLINFVIKPISMMTVDPTIVDPDYTYLQITCNVLYDPAKTNKTSLQIKSTVANAISSFAATTLNSFNSTFSTSDLTYSVKLSDPSIIANEIELKVQKKFYPNLTTPETYTFYYGVPLQRASFLSGVSSSPAVKFRDTTNLAQTIDNIYFEEIPVSSGGVESILIINPGFGYQSAPTVTITGDGVGATATAYINTNGQINSIAVTNSGNNYTSAIVTITPAAGDTTGQLGSAITTLQGQTGTLSLYYNNTNNAKTIFKSVAGTIDYTNGIITLNQFGPLSVDNPLGQLTISATPTSSIISSTYNRIVTVDPYDSTAIIVNVAAK
jgi:hypothetical protein